ncbi:MAG: hypothetical protein II863_04095 [Kiritimatiellae bacterium]|nr:hypothetical protein [Kiritimatiellia bacterium]
MGLSRRPRRSALVGAHLRGARIPAYPPERSGVAEGELNAGCKSAALETAFVMGEMRDVWYNMRIENQMIASDNQIVVYQPNETVRLDVRLENEVQTNEPPLQSIFYQNQFWDAKSLLIKFIRQAKKELIVIDAYPGVATGKCCQCENVASHQFQFPIGEAA